jgi:LysM repeat protein
MLDHFSLVADTQARTIVDSYDGEVKVPGFYGEPVAYATYEAVTPHPIRPLPVNHTKSKATSEPKHGSTYTMLKDDTIWEVARRYNFSAQELIEHNDITDPVHLPIGYVVHFPTPVAMEIEDPIRYELLAEIKTMHISKPGGAGKWSFGNVKEWNDFTSSGHFPEGTNLQIVAIAHVPVGKETAAYYMDALALGDYAHSGRVAYTVGYSWRDVADGLMPASKAIPAPPAEPVVEIPAEEPKLSPNAYKGSYQPFTKPVLYTVKETMKVYELDGRRPTKTVYSNDEYDISGTFTKDDIIYARPTLAAQSFYWFGIPMDNLIPNEELYNTKLDLPDRAALHKLSFQERMVDRMGRLVSRYPKVMDIIKQK